MGRAENIAIPCSASLAELAHDRGVQEFSAEDLKEARDDLIEKLLAGDKFERVDLETIIDMEADRNYPRFLRDLYEHFANVGGRDSYDVAQDAERWMKRLVEFYVDNMKPELITEMAGEIATARMEDSE